MAFNLDPSRLLRNPLSAAKLELLIYVNLEPRAFPSPDGTKAVVCSHDFEPRMGANCFLFNLVNLDGRFLNRFEPVLGEGKRDNCVWSSDSRRFAITISGKRPAIFVYDIAQQFVIIPVQNIYQFTLSFETPRRLRMTFDEDQVPKETKFVLGTRDGTKVDSVADLVHVPYHAPSRRYRAPDPIEIHLPELQWFPWSEYEQGAAYCGRFPPISFSPVFEGFYPYGGPFPATTEGLLVCRMMDFADYGDAQCKVWMDAIRRRRGDHFSQWEPAERYLGVRQRTIAPPALTTSSPPPPAE